MDLGFTHLFHPGQDNQPVLLLLHGTGGNEHDLLSLARDVAPGAGLLSVRGKVLENGMPRFFRRLAEGVFDLADLAVRTSELNDFIVAARRHYDLGEKQIFALGYSNGANIASSLLLTYPDSLSGAILLRGMMPFDPGVVPDLRGKTILMLNGALDPIIPHENAQRLAKIFTEAHADLTQIQQPTGHGLIQSDIDEMQRWWADRDTVID